jgi:hypothetical protein
VSGKIYGLRAAGNSDAEILANNSNIFGNTTGLFINGDALYSYGNNRINGNATNGAPARLGCSSKSAA